MPSDQLYSLPFEQQIGQFFFIGLPGTELDEATRELIEEVKPGGIIIFGRNVASPQQLRGLLDGARALLPVAPLCGIDQEGGLVDRLREIFPPMPSARAIRQHGDLAGARTLGRVTGEVLRMLGFDLNFAPVMSIITRRPAFDDSVTSSSRSERRYALSLPSAGCAGRFGAICAQLAVVWITDAPAAAASARFVERSADQRKLESS